MNFVAADSAPSRKPRADAERNRQRLVDTARAAFTAEGVSVSLEEIARQAGVGIGTLYRHFPTRDELIAEVYRLEVDKLAEGAAQLAETKSPLEALRAWLFMFIDYLSTKLILADALKAMVGEPGRIYAATSDQLRDAMTMLMERAEANGDLAVGQMDPFDLLRAIGGISSAGTGWEPSARTMVDVLLNGLKRG
jgi:AcrR family transcriptional regulator